MPFPEALDFCIQLLPRIFSSPGVPPSEYSSPSGEMLREWRAHSFNIWAPGS
jgi:hypothetical protein